MSYGTYVKLKPSRGTKQKFADFANLFNVENPTSLGDLHVTVVYSEQQCPNIESLSVDLPVYANGIGFDIFPQADGTSCLVLLLESQAMHVLHSICKTEYGATHNFPTYKPHITLSYDYPNGKIPNSDWLEMLTDLEFDCLGTEPLNCNWTSHYEEYI